MECVHCKDEISRDSIFHLSHISKDNIFGRNSMNYMSYEKIVAESVTNRVIIIKMSPGAIPLPLINVYNIGWNSIVG